MKRVFRMGFFSQYTPTNLNDLNGLTQMGTSKMGTSTVSMKKRKYVKSGKYSKKQVVKTLRDEFAMAALTGLLALNANEKEIGTNDRFAFLSYRLADVMLTERNKTNEAK